ncbi:MAG: ABC transporter ATP-binding protein [Kiritimatiellia bacterium]
MERNDTIIEVRGVTKVFKTGRGLVRAIDGVDLDILEGEYLSVMGPSGSGKSTLFNMIGALDRPTGGTVEIGGVFLGKLNNREAAYFRSQHMGYIFQAYNLIPSLTALKNVALPVSLAGASTAEAISRATQALDEVGLGERIGHRPEELSGGQQQRVAIARAIVNKPSILLADEPTANLDLHTGEQIIDLLRSLCRKHGVTVITATHDHAMLAVSDRVVWIADGKIKKIAKSSELRIKTGSLV